MSKKPRKNHLIKPKLQWKLVLVFLCLSAVGVFFEAMMVNRVLVGAANRLPNDSSPMLAEIPGVLGNSILVTLALVVPLVASFGILATFRIAGPLYRLERHLMDLLAGRTLAPLKLRRHDELQELCDLINQVTARMVQEKSDDSQGAPPEPLRKAS